MQTPQRSSTLLSFGLAIALASCVPAKGGEAAAPDGETQAEAAEAPADAADTDEAEERDSAGEGESKEAAAPVSPKTSPVEVLQHKGAMFMLNYRNSDMGKQKEAACEKKTAGDPAKKAACMTAAVNAVKREGIAFEQADDETWWYVRFYVDKGKQIELNRVQCEFGTPSGSKITVKTNGPDKARRAQGSVPSELVFDVPDEFSVTLHDPDRGAIVYDSKVGLLGDEKEDKR